MFIFSIFLDPLVVHMWQAEKMDYKTHSCPTDEGTEIFYIIPYIFYNIL